MLCIDDNAPIHDAGVEPEDNEGYFDRLKRSNEATVRKSNALLNDDDGLCSCCTTLSDSKLKLISSSVQQPMMSEFWPTETHHEAIVYLYCSRYR